MALSVIASTILASCVFVSQGLRLGFVIAFSVVFLIVLINFAVFRKKFLILLSIGLLIAIIPMLSIYCKSKTLVNNNAMLSEKCTYTGKIESLAEELDRNAIFIELSDVRILKGEEEKVFKGHVYVHLVANGVDTSKLDIGKIVTIYNSELVGMNLNKGSSESDRYYLSRGINAKGFVFGHNFSIEDKFSLNLRDKVKNLVYKDFEKTDTFFTNIGYAMLFGESSVLSDDVYGVFKDSGIAHLLAVSGFHISIIVSFLLFILNKLRANKYAKLSVVAIILLFYAYLCSFSVSVIRASIMSLLLIYARNRNKEYDKLSALSLAAVFILLICPMQFFNISFIFSFVAILSIILLTPIFERLLSNIFHEKISASISLSFAVCLGIMVFQLYYFGRYPILSVFSNVITIPVVSVLFIFLIISVLIGPIFNITVPLIKAFGSCMKYIVQFNSWISRNGLYINVGVSGRLALVLSLFLMFVVSDYLFVRKRTKWAISVPLVTMIVLMMIWWKWTRQKYARLL